MKTVVVNMRTEKGKEGDILIARPSIWGNPFKIGIHGNRKEVILKHAKSLLGRPDLLKLIPVLKGKRLRCWCAPKACHGDILAKLANSGAVTSYALRTKLELLIQEMERMEKLEKLEGSEEP